MNRKYKKPLPFFKKWIYNKATTNRNLKSERRSLALKKYEYKFVEVKGKIGLDFSKKVSDAEKQWNELGMEGWKFCTWGNGVMIFMREVDG